MVEELEKRRLEMEKKFATEDQFNAVVSKIGLLGSNLEHLKEILKIN